MPKEVYVVIYPGEGGARVYQLSKAELEKRLAEGYWGSDRKFLTEVPAEREGDTNYWGNSLLILKATVVVPQPVDVVKSYRV